MNLLAATNFHSDSKSPFIKIVSAIKDDGLSSQLSISSVNLHALDAVFEHVIALDASSSFR